MSFVCTPCHFVAITVEFHPTVYTVLENSSDILLHLKADTALPIAHNVTVNTFNVSAEGRQCTGTPVQCTNIYVQVSFNHVYFPVAGADFVGESHTATFKPGSTVATTSIPIIDDTVAELRETFNATLSFSQSPLSVNVSVGVASTATVNIDDDDTVFVQFDPTHYTVNEGDTTATLTLLADRNSTFDYIVHVRTQDGSAMGASPLQLYTKCVLTCCVIDMPHLYMYPCFYIVLIAPSDYQGGVYDVPFHAGNPTAMVNISIFDDDLYEGKADPEGFTSVIEAHNSQQPGISAGMNDTATVFIHDNEGIYEY